MPVARKKIPAKAGVVSEVARLADGPKRAAPPSTIVRPVDNAIRILRYLSVIRQPTTVTVIARELKINPSTCFNILRTLVWNGVVDFDAATKSYKTGLGAIDLANKALLRNGDMADAVQPAMERIAQAHAVTTMIWRRIGEDRMMLVAIADSPATIRIHLRLGQRLPLLIGAAGRVMAAFGSITDKEIRKRFSELEWNRGPTVDAYLAQVAKARKNGWAADEGSYVTGVHSVAAPIFNREGTLRGVAVASMFRGQHNPATVKEVIDDIRKLADSIGSLAPQSA
jgi:DNA-binding IclR family transcriptional regulator